MKESIMVEEFLRDINSYDTDFVNTYEAVSHSRAIYKGKPVPYLHIPKLYSREDVETFEYALSGMFDVVNRTIELYLQEPTVRDLFAFDQRLDQLIRLPHYYKSNVPMGRFDIFHYGPQSFKFCELNADGASAMNEELELTQILSETELMNHFKQNFDFKGFELFHSWVKQVQIIFEEYSEQRGISVDRPTVAIVDFIDKGSSIEFEVFKLAFEQGGFNCIIVDPKDIACVDGKMIAENNVIDIVYRRLVTKDMMDRYDEIPGFIEGIKAGQTCLIGSIKTQIIHTKRFFEVLYEPSFRAHLNEKQLAFVDAHVPYTRPLKYDSCYEAYSQNKDQYIIKPVDYYASKGVCAGKDYTQEAWTALLEEKLKEDYIIQEYCPLALIQNIIHKVEGGYKETSLSTVTGMFTYNEVFAGLYVRAGLKSIISGLHDGFTMSSLVVEPKMSTSD